MSYPSDVELDAIEAQSTLVDADQEIVAAEADLLRVVERLGAVHARRFLAMVEAESRWAL